MVLNSCEMASNLYDSGKTYISDLLQSDSATGSKPSKNPKAKPPRTTRPISSGKLSGSAKTQSPKTESSVLQGDANLVVTRESDEKQNIKSTDLKSAVAPEFKVEAPVHVLKRVGGVASFISGDDRFVYVDFPQHFAVYDANMNQLATKSTAFPVLKVSKFVRDNRMYLFLKEENNIFEVFELVQTSSDDKAVYTLKEVISKEMESDFDWIRSDLVVAFMSKKIQFLDTADFENIKILNEMPMSHVFKTFASGNHIFIARDDFLDIVNLEKFETTSSIRIGRKFDFLGTTTNGDKTDLLLSLLNTENQLEGLQYLHLNAEKNSVSDFGDNITFNPPLDDISVSTEEQLVMGREVGSDPKASPLQIYSLKHKRFLRGPVTSETNIRAWSFNRNLLYLVNSKQISINIIKLDEKTIEQSATLKSFLDDNSQTPLAQIGAAKIMKDEYELQQHKQVNFMSDAQKVVLLDADHFVLFEKTVTGDTDRIFTTTEFSSEGFLLTEPTGSNQTKFDKVLVTGFGLLLYSSATEKIYLMDIDLKTIHPLPISVHQLVSWTQFSTSAGEALAIAHKSTEKSLKPYIVDFFIMHAPDNIQKKQTLSKSEKPFLFYIPDNQVITVEESQMSLYSIYKLLDIPEPPKPIETAAETTADETTDILKTETTKSATVQSKASKTKNSKVVTEIAADEVVSFQSTDDDEDKPGTQKSVTYTAVETKISPNFDLIYSLFEEQGRFKIRIMDIFDVNRTAVMDDFEITLEQFRGSSFSKEGRLFILPSNEGTLFYDVSKLEEIREVAHWPLASNFVDIANRGKWICVALGYQGVYCGDLLF